MSEEEAVNPTSYPLDHPFILAPKPMKRLLLSIDFDDTIAKIGEFPEILGEMPGAIESLKELHAEGHRIQIWTCRHGEWLDQARAWLDENKVPYERINENCPNLIDKWGETRKMSADLYIDDKMLGGLPPWGVIVRRVRKHVDTLHGKSQEAILCKQPKLIGLSGKRGSGKNTVATMMQEANYFYQEHAFASKLKYFATQLIGEGYDVYSQQGKTEFIPEWGMTVGELLQRLGTDAIRNGLHQQAWVLACFAGIEPDAYAIVTDCRFPNEVDAIQARGGIVLRIEGDPLKQHGDGTRDDAHSSETALDGYKGFDGFIYNDGTLEDLRGQVEGVLAFPYPTR